MHNNSLKTTIVLWMTIAALLVSALFSVSDIFNSGIFQKACTVSSKHMEDITSSTFWLQSKYSTLALSGFVPKTQAATSSADIVDRFGNKIASFAPEQFLSDREYKAWDPELESLVFIEDRSYLARTEAVSVKWFLRAVKSSFFWKKEGASGITQQIVKNLVLKDNQTNFWRKLKEAIVSYYLERRFSKIELANLYLNQISYGKNVFGIEQASKRFFWADKPNLVQSFMLNSLLKEPTYLYKNPKALKDRTKTYLADYLSLSGYPEWSDIFTRAMKMVDESNLSYNPGKTERNKDYDQYALDYVLKKRQSWELPTNAVLNVSEPIQLAKDTKNSVTEEISKNTCKKYAVCDVGIVVLDRDTNSIAFHYAGDYQKSQVDPVFSNLEIGSTMKPFFYAEEFTKNGFHDALSNAKICIWGYCPDNWNFSSGPYVSLSTALRLSYNLPVMHVVHDSIWLDDAKNTVMRLGLYESGDLDTAWYAGILGTVPTKPYLLARAYTAFWDGYVHDIPVAFSGTLRKPDEKTINAEFSQESLTNIKKVLVGPNGVNTNWMVKTGTSSNWKDELIVWISDRYVMVMWMWNKDGSPTNPGAYAVTKGKKIADMVFKYIDDREMYLKDHPLDGEKIEISGSGVVKQ